MAIAECLELPLEILTNENLIFIDDFLENEISPIKAEKNSDDYTRKFAMGTVKYLYDLSNRFCPLSISDEFGLSEGFHIATMSEMVLYLPLCRLYHLYDLISRIGGDIDGREGYILKQSEFLYETIPDIPAKHYVDNCIMKYRIEKKEKLDENEEKEKQRLEKYWRSEEMQRDYKHYYDIVQQWFKLSQDDTMRCILEQKFPEVYAEDIEYRKECLKNKEFKKR